jgi:hypothetical protein
VNRSGFVLLIALAATASAQHWDIEQVDTAPWNLSVRVCRAPDGSLAVCYEGVDVSALRLAWKDTFWVRDSVPLAGGLQAGLWSFAPEPQGAVGVAYRDSMYVLHYAHRDTDACSVAGR